MARVVLPRPRLAEPQRSLRSHTKYMSAYPPLVVALVVALAHGQSSISTRATARWCNSLRTPLLSPADIATSPSTTTTSKRLVTAKLPIISSPTTTPLAWVEVRRTPSNPYRSSLPQMVRTYTTPSRTAIRPAAQRARTKFQT